MDYYTPEQVAEKLQISVAPSGNTFEKPYAGFKNREGIVSAKNNWSDLCSHKRLIATIRISKKQPGALKNSGCCRTSCLGICSNCILAQFSSTKIGLNMTERK